jgi:lysozyme
MKILITKEQEERLLEQVLGKAPSKNINIDILPQPFNNYGNSIPSAISLIKKHEGFCDGTKDCPPYTIGYGTRTDLHPELKGKKIDDAVATAYVKKDLEDNIIPAIKRIVKVPLKDHQVSALISLIYNIGPGNFRKSQLLKDLNNNNLKGVKKNWEEFTSSQGKTLGGLANRRWDEIRLFFDEK